MIFRTLLPLLCLLVILAPAHSAEKLQLQKGDHIAIIGNALADRMQHSSYLEALIYSAHPEHNLVFRNLGFSGDELNTRLRSEGFGSPNDWLKHVKADVILAFFGYNESYKGEQGLQTFRGELEKFINDTKAQNYSGKGAPRLVLFSPVAFEKHTDPNFPTPEQPNARLRPYVTAMREVAEKNSIQFVDLFAASQEAYRNSDQPLTVNSLHLTDAGYKALAAPMYEALIGGPAPSTAKENFSLLVSAIQEKNHQWHQRYRTVDGYNVYGGRSFLKFGDTMNRDTMQREMEIRDVMAANRDKRVWAAANGKDIPVNDDNLPAPIEVPTNKPGKQPDGAHVFLSGEEAIKNIKIPQGLKISLFADEAKFPLLANPVQMAFDTKGRLWVAVWPNYPERTPTSKIGDSLLVFEDTDNDGKADKCTPFAEDLNCPTGFQFYKDGVILVQAPDVWFLRDTDNDGKADFRERILNGLDSADSHHTANALCLDPGGAIYLSDGVFHRSQMETPWGPPVRNIDAAIYRFEPRTSKIETYISYGFANPHGRVFDYWGNDFVTDATGNNTYFGPAFSGKLDYPHKHSSLKQFWNRPSRPCPGTAILSSRHFPDEYQNNFLNINVIGFQGIFRVKFTEDGSGVGGETLPHLVESTDPNFRPIAVDVAPDGSIYFLDWHNPIIGHMQHHLRDPSRDKIHGRVYRITHESRPLLKPAKIAGQPIPHLLDLLKTPEDNVRTRAKIELGARNSKDVIAAVQTWAGQFDAYRSEHQHHLMEALWVHQWHNVVNEPLLKQMLRSPEPNARAAALRVLCYWRDRVSQPLPLVKAAANDESPRVRLEAIRTASFFEGREAIETAYEILKYDTDYYLDYTFKETMRQLQKDSSDIVLPADSRALARVINNLSDKQLLAAKDSEPILYERLTRRQMDLNTRSAALDALVKLKGSSRVAETIQALKRLEGSEPAATTLNDLGMLLGANPVEDLTKARPQLLSLATDSKRIGIRKAALAGVLSADDNPEKTWENTSGALKPLLVESLQYVTDPAFRAKLRPSLVQALENSDTRLRHAILHALPLTGPEHAKANFNLLATQIKGGKDTSVAARSLLQLPRDSWNREQAATVSDSIVQWASKVPAGERTSQEFVETVQAGMETASLLPPAEATKIRKQLLELGVSVFVIRSVREQMRYDTTRLVVEAGKPFELILINDDMMPHNLVIVKPGAREEIGKAAERMPATPDRTGKIYVPNSDKVIASSKLLEPAQTERMKLTAPKSVGTYEYVCTYPEHWKVMFGELIVVKNMDEFLQASASAQLKEVAKPAASHAHDH